ncbi:histidine phosphatase family protein [Shimia sp. R10_1]|uniref:SixA phosphatase family protein n=1 Tax=Shimia sp. R10_1 TaxID=2821095 RepID=UPI001AD9897A|nr:histidine phosphatase family protein [Shimia sp. R10_1]MBO9472767.1 histidine phosphatase family protein [Shimia sp. R10_1]
MRHTLILMRHAKSSWGEFNQPDHARPLNKRGRASAHALGKWLAQKHLFPDEVFCSSSERTRETLDRLTLPSIAKVSHLDSLYLASADTMLHHLREAEPPTILMIGHNPGIAHFAEQLATQTPDHPRFQDYPTAATTIFHFDLNHWKDAQYGAGQVVDFVIPRELMARDTDL